MRLYSWQPNGHGELSFFVMAETLEAARQAVEAEIARLKAGGWREGSAYGWGTDYYTLTIAKTGEVLTNENQ